MFHIQIPHRSSPLHNHNMPELSQRALSFLFYIINKLIIKGT